MCLNYYNLHSLGSFIVSYIKSSNYKSGYSFLLTFNITQHLRDLELMNSLIKYLDCGKVYSYPNKFCTIFKVCKLELLINQIIPFFNKYHIQGSKLLDYQDFRKIALLMNDKVHLTKQGLAQIKKIKEGMNTGRKDK